MIKHLKGHGIEVIAEYRKDARRRAKELVMREIEEDGYPPISKNEILKLIKARIKKMYYVNIQSWEKACDWRLKEREIYDNQKQLEQKVLKEHDLKFKQLKQELKTDYE